MKSIFTKEYEAVLNRLISERKKRGITQQQIADYLGRPQSFVSKYERTERRLDVVEFIYVSQAIGISPAALLQELEETGGSPDASADAL